MIDLSNHCQDHLKAISAVAISTTAVDAVTTIGRTFVFGRKVNWLVLKMMMMVMVIVVMIGKERDIVLYVAVVVHLWLVVVRGCAGRSNDTTPGI